MSMPSENRPLVLVVKDDAQVLDLLVDLLKPEGYKVITAENAPRAIELTKTLRVDLVLCDVVMPEMNGLELCHHLKTNPVTAAIPIMLVSAVRKEEAAMSEGYSAGADEYLEIPFRNEELLIKVARLVERHRAQRELKKSEEEYRLLFKANPCPMWLCDQQTLKFIAVNDAAVMHYGYSREEFLAMSVKDIRSAEDVADLVEHLATTAAANAGAGVWRHRKKDDSIIDVDMTWHRVEFGGHAAFLVLANDVTARKQSETALRESEHRYREIFDNANDLIYTHDLKGNFTSLNRTGEALTGYSLAEALTMNFAEVVVTEQVEQARKMLERKLHHNDVATVYEVDIKSKNGSRITLELSTRLIYRDGKPVGVQGIGRDVTERRRAEAELLRRNQELAALNEISHELSKLREPAEIAHLIHAMIGKVIDNRNLYVALYDERKNQVSFPAYTINSQPYYAPTRKFGFGLTEHVIRIKEPLYVERDLEGLLKKMGLNLSGRSAECWLGVPMLVGEKVVGVITVQDYDQPEAYDQGHLELLRTIASHAAIAVENARLYQQSEATSAREALVNRLGQAIRSSLSLPEVLETTVREVGTALSASRVAVRLCDGNDEDLFVKTEFVAEGEERSSEFDSYYDRLLRDHFRDVTKPLVLADVQQLAEDASPIAAGLAFHAKEHHLRSTLVSPVVVKNRFRGVICIEQTDEVRHWTEDEVLLVEAVGSQLANGIAQAELFQIVARAKNEWETTFDAMSDGVFIFDPNGQLIRVNRAGATMDNTDPHAILGRKCCEILRADSDEVECIVERSLREAQSVNLEIVPYKRKRPVLVTVEPVFDAAREVIGAVCTARDLSELRKVEAVAREHQSLLKNILESANEAIYALDRTGRYQWCNQAMLALTGCRMEELIGAHFLDHVYADDREMRTLRLARVLAGEPQRYESRYVSRGGAIRHAVVNSAPIVVDGETTGVLGIAHDITEQKQERERAARADKLRALGQLASGVAHDFNNSLAAILGRAQLILRRVHDDELIRSLGVIVTAAEDAAATVRRIQTFARKTSVAEMELLDVANLLRDAVEITRTRWQNEARAAGRNIEVVLNAEGSFLTRGNASELREVFVNLIVNAVDAMRDGGRLTICCKHHKDRLQLRFADTGVGMEEEVRERIFEPFYTTKGVHGTGLGLAVSYGIIERHLGTISVSSKPGEGSVFHLELPVHHAAEHRTERARTGVDVLPSLSVLVIDDEQVVRETLAEILEELDHRVVTADSGRDALDKVAADDFDLVFTDLAMPEMDGWETAREIRRQKPELPVVLVTGYGATAQPPSGETDLVVGIIGKPFDFTQVTGTIARVCAQ